MIIDCTAKEAFERLGEYRIVYQDIFRPADLKGTENSPYRREYEWLSSYETILKRELKSWLTSYRMELFGTADSSGIISEIIANAYRHGNDRNPQLTIEVETYLGKKTMLVRVRDSGKGFDYRYVIDRMRSGKRYYNVAGNGLRRMHESKDVRFFFENNGTEVYLMISIQ